MNLDIEDLFIKKEVVIHRILKVWISYPQRCGQLLARIWQMRSFVDSYPHIHNFRHSIQNLYFNLSVE